MKSKAFRKLPQAAFRGARGQRLFELVWRHVAAQVEDAPYQVDERLLEAVPTEAQTIYWLWRFQCEAGSGGIEVFVLNALGQRSPEIHRALRAVGADELVRRLEATVAIAGDSSADFSQGPNCAWFEQFRPLPEFASLQAVDAGVFPVVGALTDLAETFILKNEQTFVDA
jgi:hypothetical protein